jgi:hypothetical protein
MTAMYTQAVCDWAASDRASAALCSRGGGQAHSKLHTEPSCASTAIVGQRCHAWLSRFEKTALRFTVAWIAAESPLQQAGTARAEAALGMG